MAHGINRNNLRHHKADVMDWMHLLLAFYLLVVLAQQRRDANNAAAQIAFIQDQIADFHRRICNLESGENSDDR